MGRPSHSGTLAIQRVSRFGLLSRFLMACERPQDFYKKCRRRSCG